MRGRGEGGPLWFSIFSQLPSWEGEKASAFEVGPTGTGQPTRVVEGTSFQCRS